MRLAVVTCLFVAALGACKGDQQKCEQACRNAAPLLYWETADAEIAALPEDQREKEKKKKLARFSHDLETGIDFCVSRCVSANNDEQAECMIAAKTAKEVHVCVNNDY